MFPTFLISFREFFEAFLIIGVFFGISRKLKLRKEFELILATILGLVISLLLPLPAFFFGEQAKTILNEKNGELLEGYLMMFSGIFLAYVVLSLHNFFRKKRGLALIKAHQKLQKNIFDLSLFLTITFFIVREGFEIALFTATTSLFSRFMENVFGLFLGFFAASLIGCATFFAYIKFPIGKIFKYTECLIILLGAAMVKNGLSELLEVYFNIHLKTLVAIQLPFIPDKETIVGHLLKTMTGIQQEFSFLSLGIMVAYITTVAIILQRRTKLIQPSKAQLPFQKKK